MKRGLFIIVLLILSLLVLDQLIPDMGVISTSLAQTVSSVFGSDKATETTSQPIWNTDWSNAINILLTLLMASVLSALISYRRSGGQAQMDFTEAHVVLSASAALMMLIIGSQIARAFGLMGAASIVRYRYSLKSPKEASSLVIALGIGMACGVGLYPLAVITALYITVMINLFEYLPSGLRGWLFPTNQMWNARIRTHDPETTIEDVEDYLDSDGIDYNIKRVLDGKGPDNNQTEIEIDIFADIDRHKFADRFPDVIRIRWKKVEIDGIK